MGIQKTDWGQIEWMENREEGVFSEGMKVGIVTMKPGSHHPPHRHYDEQVNYVIQGRAESYINGKREILEPGSFTHWGAGVVHEIYNHGEIPFVHFMISNPAGREMEYLFSDRRGENSAEFLPKKRGENSRKFPPEKRKKNSEEFLQTEASREQDGQNSLLLQAIDAVRVQFLEPMQCPYSIFDEEGVLVSQGKYFSAYCRRKCSSRSGDPRKNPCMSNENGVMTGWDCEFQCPYSLTILNVPIAFRGKFIGYIQGGYFWKSSNGATEGAALYDTPESTALSMHNLFHSVSRAIENYCEFQYYRRDMEEKTFQISREEEMKEHLLKDLKEAEYTVTDLRINHHFLFNTLNCMAVQAIDAQAFSLYQSVQALAKMFQYTLRTSARRVPLKMELEYVKAYLQLQKLRYKDQLEIFTNVDETALDLEIPFNFLQPVVENVFVHGFHDAIQKRIEIEVKKEDGFLAFTIRGAGKGLEEEEYRRINREILEHQIHGLSLVNYKLKNMYGEQGSLRIEPDEEGGTCFQIRIPVGTDR